MTLAEMEQKIAKLEAELNLLRHEVLRLRGVDVIPGIGPIGMFRDDPSFADTVKFGKAYRDKVNKASLKEFDKEQAEAKKKAKSRKPNARA
ncbi:unnamed protein product [Gemmataceae bacterium]|nr:unnamed protein product [Gemmataceae bacterium]VTU01362.1 unnamed protein product [Gemmataceae bacterium]